FATVKGSGLSRSTCWMTASRSSVCGVACTGVESSTWLMIVSLLSVRKAPIPTCRPKGQVSASMQGTILRTAAQFYNHFVNNPRQLTKPTAGWEPWICRHSCEEQKSKTITRGCFLWGNVFLAVKTSGGDCLKQLSSGFRFTWRSPRLGGGIDGPDPAEES